ncbi:MHYT domain-containing protein [Crenothrix polyspora]|uniref:MHYT n=1 Tax=Crenothrix polyspora TaxID=360316 RepID=A0A1R4H6F2_9GAMM|nr:MHYT domain-containing protein [Crenothrix polyspora]SJM91440.1 MHYT [Crenothrix polyspora]
MANYNISLVLLSYVVAVIGSLMALIATRDALQRPADRRRGLIILAALCLGGVAIWSMHFIGMSAFDMQDMTMSYNAWLTALSFVVGVGVVYAGLAYMTTGKFRYRKLIIAGVLVGLGVVAMHYTGILSMQVQADAHWNSLLIMASIVIAVVAAIVALWLAVHVQHFWQMVISSLIMATAVCGMHYTGMAAVEFVHNMALPVVQIMPVTASVFSMSVVTVDILIIVLAIAQALSEANQRKSKFI